MGIIPAGERAAGAASAEASRVSRDSYLTVGHHHSDRVCLGVLEKKNSCVALCVAQSHVTQLALP